MSDQMEREDTEEVLRFRDGHDASAAIPAEWCVNC